MNVEPTKTVHGAKCVEMVDVISLRSALALAFMTQFVAWMVEPILTLVRLDVLTPQSELKVSVSHLVSQSYVRSLVNMGSLEMTMAVRCVDAKRRLYVETLKSVDNLKSQIVRLSVDEALVSLNASSMNALI